MRCDAGTLNRYCSSGTQTPANICVHPIQSQVQNWKNKCNFKQQRKQFAATFANRKYLIVRYCQKYHIACIPCDFSITRILLLLHLYLFPMCNTSKICLVSQSILAHCFISFFSLVSMLFLLLFYSRVITVSIDKSRYAIRDWLACILFAHRFTRTNYRQRPHIEQHRIRTIHFWRRAHVRRGEKSVASHTRRIQMVFRVLRVCIARSFVNCT